MPELLFIDPSRLLTCRLVERGGVLEAGQTRYPRTYSKLCTGLMLIMDGERYYWAAGLVIGIYC